MPGWICLRFLYVRFLMEKLILLGDRVLPLGKSDHTFLGGRGERQGWTGLETIPFGGVRGPSGLDWDGDHTIRGRGGGRRTEDPLIYPRRLPGPLDSLTHRPTVHHLCINCAQ